MAAVDAYSTEWAAAYRDEINRSDVYRESSAGWEGSVGLVVLAEPDKNFPADHGVFLDLWHGEARDIHVCSREEAETAAFVLTAPYSTWKDVAQGRLDATRGIMQGQIRLRGDLPTIVRYTRGAEELTACTMRLPVRWPDEATG